MAGMSEALGSSSKGSSSNTSGRGREVAVGLNQIHGSDSSMMGGHTINSNQNNNNNNSSQLARTGEDEDEEDEEDD